MVIYDDMDPEQRPLNYTKTCGPHTPSRVETDVQVAREAGSLMVYYSTRADIPSTPREVSNLITGGSGPLVDFGAAPDAVLVSCTPLFTRFGHEMLIPFTEA